MLKHIYVDEKRINRFDRYFSYIESVKSELPLHLYEFASDISRYSLDGLKTLHDAWLEELKVSTRYEQDSNVVASSEVVLRFRQAFEGTITIAYSGVEAFEYRNVPNRWPDRATDLLVHEVSVESDGVYSHTLVFDKDVVMKVLFRDFSLEESVS